jgi:hypothetical protein
VIGATGADVSGGLARAHNARVHFGMIQLAWRSAGKGQRLAVIAARRRNLEPVAAAYLESANRRVVLVLHHDLSLRLQQRPAIVASAECWRAPVGLRPQARRVKPSRQPGQAHAERPQPLTRTMVIGLRVCP